MDEKPKAEDQSLITKLVESRRPIRGAFQLIFWLVFLLVAFLCLKSGIEHAINAITQDRKLLWGFIALVLSVTALSALICAFFIRVFLERRYDRDFQKLQEIGDELKDASEKIRRISQLEELHKKGRWLLTDPEAQKIEAKVDSMILVVSTDLFFEKQSKWLDIIATNIAKTDAPVYKYFVQDLQANRNEEQRIRALLLQRLQAKGVGSPQQLITDRFKVKYLERCVFPNVVFNGFAIYRFSDPKKDCCLLYFPREQWEWNVNLFAGNEVSRKRANEFIAEAERQLEVLPTKP